MEKITLTGEVAAKLIGASDATELSGLLEGVAEENISNVYADAVASNFGSLRKRVAEDKLKQGIKQKGLAIERELSPLFEKYDISDFSTAEEGIKLLADKLGQDKSTMVDLSTLTPEQIQELPAYQKALKAAAQANERAESIEGEFQQYKTAQAQAATMSEALRVTTSIFEEGNANTGSATKADAAKMFLSTIPPERLSLVEGQVVVLDDDGQILKDDYGNVVTYKDYVKKNYLLGFGVASPDSTGSGAGAGSKGGGASPVVITSREQGEAMIRQAYDSGDRKAVAAARKVLGEFLAKNPDA